jgi:uncharacterized protein YggE
MRTKLSLIVSILVLALVLSACGPSAPTAIRSLTVSGNGSVYLTPDIAYIYIGVHTDDADLATAVSKNNTEAQTLVDALKKAGVAGADIQTSNFSVYTNPNGGIDKMTGQAIANGTSYSVDNSVYVTVRDLTHLGSLLNAAVSAGANSINSITFDVADKTAAQTQARQKAMDNAASLAGELAQTAKVTLGAIQTITYSDNTYSSYYGMGGGGASAPNASVPIQPGQTQVSVSVSITYAIK